jgi:hypothetical protein
MFPPGFILKKRPSIFAVALLQQTENLQNTENRSLLGLVVVTKDTLFLLIVSGPGFPGSTVLVTAVAKPVSISLTLIFEWLPSDMG